MPRARPLLWFAATLLAASTLTACKPDDTRDDGLASQLGDDDDDDDDGDAATTPNDDRVGAVGMRRLSRRELDDTLRDLVGETERLATQYLPEDVLDPFDNDYSTQRVSAILIEGLERLASDVSLRLMADTARRDEVVGCTPTGTSDTDCMGTFIDRFGRRALRRPITADERDRWLVLGQNYAGLRDDFYEGIDVLVRMFLQHPHFVYRIERGEPTDEDGVFRLDDYEVATRLSYFLWGTMPDDSLDALADAGQLSQADHVRSAAQRLLDDPRARARVEAFHAMWLGFISLPHDPELTSALRLETRELLDQQLFEARDSWLDLFRATGTYANDYLAQHYGLTPPGTDAFVWVEYGPSGRQGLLSHGSFLSLGAKFEDTSPTLRGLAIRTRLLCQSVPPPPPDVDTDNPPGADDPDACKEDRYAEHGANGACHSCHSLIDPIGFGLENYDRAGRYREHDLGAPECTISGEGAVGDDTFVGPSGLADLLVDGTALDACVVRQLYRFAMGHDVDDDDQAYVDDLVERFRERDHQFDALILDLVADPAFLFRREPKDD